jgi:PAS domain S-box-containing protein
MKQIESTQELKKTIPWRLILVFICFSVAIILGGIFFYQSQRNRIFTENQNSLTAISTLKIGQIEQWRKERLGDAATIYNNWPLIRSIKQYFDNENQPEIRRELINWMESVYTGYDYSGVCILDTLLRTRLSISRFDSVRTIRIKNELQTVLQKKTVVFTDLHQVNSADSIHSDLLVPLLDPQSFGQKPFGILILRIDPDKILFPLIQSWPTPSKSSETLILRQDGDSITYLNELRHQHHTALTLKLPLSKTNLLASMVVNGHRGIAEGIDYRNKEVVGYLATIPDFNWFMVAKVDKEEIQSPLQRFLIITFIVCVLLILMNASVFGLFIWNQRIKMYRLRLKDELAIRESEERFNIAFRMSPVSVTISTMNDNKFIDVNDSFLKDMEYSREEVIGRTARELNVWANEVERLWVVDELREKGKIFGKVISYKSKKGSVIYGLSSMSIVRVNGEPCNLSTVINITENRKAEKKLIESEKQYRMLFESINDAVMISELTEEGKIGKFIQVNDAACKRLGYSREELMMMTPLNINSEKSKLTVNLKIRRIIEEKHSMIEAEHVTKDGRIFPVEISTNVIHFNNKTLFLSIARDLTERKLAEEEIRLQSEILSHMADAVYLVRMRDGIIVFANSKFESMFGYKEGEMVGKHVSIVNAPTEKSPQETAREIMDSLAEKGLWTGEVLNVRKDGTNFWTQANVTIFDHFQFGEVLISVQNDITERKLVEESLRESERKLREAQEMAHLGFWLWDINTGYVEWSDEVFKIFWLDPKKFKPQIDSILALSPWEEDNRRDKELIDKAIKSHSPGSYEQKFLRPDNSVGYYYSTFQGVYNEKGDVTSIVGTVLDITEPKIAESKIKQLNEELELRVIQRTRQLEAVNKELEAFSYSVSHDLRAPLRSVHGYTKILLEEYENKLDDEGKRICKIISSSATQMGGLIDDLLSFSRIGRSTLNPSTIDMKKMVRLLFEGMTSPSERERIVITIGKLQKSFGDVALIGQVWVNLLSNAIKYTSKKDVSEITVGSQVDGDLVTYFVKDNGVGFDMTYSHKLFGVFQRLHSEREFEGNGVGLAIIQRIVLKHGGKVWAEGEVGKGATFYFSLPFNNEEKGNKKK